MTEARPWQHLDPEHTTIFALATPPGISAVAVVRVSGSCCHDLLPVLFPSLECTPDDLPAWRLRRCALLLGEEAGSEIADDVLLALFKGPKSFTGQDAFEIHSHGSPFILARLSARLEELGVRQAQPGEFTRRALLSGKMDLSQAEGLKDLIHAQSSAQWQAARYLATGSLHSTIERLRKKLIGGMAFLEAMIDFPDEGDTKDVHLGEVTKRVAELKAELLGLKDSYASGRIAREGLKVVIAGFPNQGKSTLLNQLIQKNRAIVSAIEGTTRDYLEEPCLIAGRLIRLFDTAGIRPTHDPIEKQGVAIAEELLGEADLALIVISAENALAEDGSGRLVAEQQLQMVDHFKALAERSSLRVIWLINKTDLLTPEQLSSLIKALRPHLGEARAVALSCTTGEGMADLYSAISSEVDANLSALGREDFLANARHHAAVVAALSHIEAFEEALAAEQYEECLAFELSEVSHALASIVGAVDHEDVLDQVFADFCIGK